MHMQWMNGVGRALAAVAGAMAVLGGVREGSRTAVVRVAGESPDRLSQLSWLGCA